MHDWTPSPASGTYHLVNDVDKKRQGIDYDTHASYRFSED